ncbi:hypothetical protein Tco_0551647, partial [Tanacetum coccineum]
IFLERLEVSDGVQLLQSPADPVLGYVASRLIVGIRLLRRDFLITTSILVIVYDEKLARLPYGNETLTIQGGKGESRLNIISCIKTQKYIQKGFHVFLSHIKENKSEEKLEEKRLEDVPVVRDFSKVFLKDLHGLLPTRKFVF